MFRIWVTLLAFALVASACASHTYVVGESTVQGPSASSSLDLEAAMATVEPRPTATATVAVEAERSTPAPTATTASTTTTEPTVAPAPTVAPEPTVTPLPTVTPAPPEPELADRFAVGGCYRSASHQAGAAIPCSHSHRAEVVMIGRFSHGPDAPFPGHDVASDLVNEDCVPVANSVGLVDGSGMSTIPAVPLPRQWVDGDRSYVCFLRFEESVTSTLASIATRQQTEQAERRASAQAARDAANKESADQFVAEQQMQIGDCVLADNITKVPCSDSHSYVVYARANLASAGGVYPGVSLILEQSEEYCRREHVTARLSGDIVSLHPAQWEWEDYGIHTVVCMVSTS